MGLFGSIGKVIGGVAPVLGPALGIYGAIKGRNRASAPAAAAQEYVNRNPAIGHQYYDPFITQGQQAQQGLMPQYQKMAFNTPEFYNAFAQSYQESPAYQYMHNKLMKSAGNTAAAGGFLGTDYDVQNRAELMHSLLGQDLQQYLDNLYKIQGSGLAGLENQAGRGYESSGKLADFLAGTNLTGGNLAYAGQSARNEGRAGVYDALSNLISGPQANSSWKGLSGMFS